MGGFSGWKQGIIAMAFRGVARGGGALGARAPPLDEKYLEGDTGLKNYSQESKHIAAGRHPP